MSAIDNLKKESYESSDVGMPPGVAIMAILELADSIKALTERVRELEDRQWLDSRKLPFDTGPVLNDGKALDSLKK